MRTDPYQTRELCLAAGIEPDSRIGEGRGQPAWCTFRDAARKEHVAAEQASVAAELAASTIAPQASQVDGDGMHLTYNTWVGGRMSDCRINGTLVNPTAFRRFLHGRKRRPNKMTPQRLRWNLIRYIGPRS